MKKSFYLLSAAAVVMAGCADDGVINDTIGGNNQQTQGGGEISFDLKVPGQTRADIYGATAAEMLGNKFVVEGTKGNLPENTPTTTVVFDNYLVQYTANTAASTESNTHNWEYVGVTHDAIGTATETQIGRTVTSQTIKYWDYSLSQYDFIAYSTGNKKMVAGTNKVLSGASAIAADEVKVTKIDKNNLSTSAFQFSAQNVAAFKECYITDVTPVLKENYGNVVTLKFKSLAAKVRVGLYETVPGYSVKDVKFYASNDDTDYTWTEKTVETGASVKGLYIRTGAGTTENPYVYTACADDANGDGSSTYCTKEFDDAKATVASALYTTNSDVIPQSGTITVMYKHTGSNNKSETDYNKASVTVEPGSTTATKLTFGDMPQDAIGKTAPTATMAGTSSDNFFTTVLPNSTGKNLTLRVNYTLVSDDGSGEEIKVYGASAVVPSTYTNWQSNYAYTYIFKISDKTNGITNKLTTDPEGLFPITFDAVVTAEVNAEQTTITTVATPSITTYQYQTNNKTDNTDEYKKKADNIYAMIQDGSTTETLAGVSSLATAKYVSLYSFGATAKTEAEIIDALLKQEKVDGTTITGRNGIVLTQNANIAVTNTIDKGVDGNAITLTSKQAASITANNLSAGYYALVYVVAPETTGKQVIAYATSQNLTSGSYHELTLPADDATVTTATTAAKDHVYFRKNFKADGTTFDSWTLVDTKEGVTNVAGLYEGSVNATAATGTLDFTNKKYVNIYQEYGATYAVKVIKVVE